MLSHKDYIREWRKRNPEKVERQKINHRKHNREILQDRKFSIMAIYSDGQPKCACCGETEIDFLSIDHINNDGAKYRGKYRKTFYNWIIENNCPDDLQVLCMNCQFGKKLNNGVCPHKK